MITASRNTSVIASLPSSASRSSSRGARAFAAPGTRPRPVPPLDQGRQHREQEHRRQNRADRDATARPARWRSTPPGATGTAPAREQRQPPGHRHHQPGSRRSSGPISRALPAGGARRHYRSGSMPSRRVCSQLRRAASLARGPCLSSPRRGRSAVAIYGQTERQRWTGDAVRSIRARRGRGCRAGAQRARPATSSCARGTGSAAADLDRLRDAGVRSVIAARFDADDVAEDEAAARLAVAGRPARRSRPPRRSPAAPTSMPTAGGLLVVDARAGRPVQRRRRGGDAGHPARLRRGRAAADGGHRQDHPVRHPRRAARALPRRAGATTRCCVWRRSGPGAHA